MRSVRCGLAGWLAMSWCVASAAADDIFTLSLEELMGTPVTVSTGTPRPRETAPAAITVITAAEIRAMGARSVDDALETVPGLHVSRSSFQYAPRYFFRGIVSSYNPQALVLVDGVPMTSLFVGDRGENLPTGFSLPVHMVERIEVIRGPGSAVYGADAFAGVINVITRAAEGEAEGNLQLGAGSFDSGHARLRQTGTLGDVRGIVSLSRYGTGGDRGAIIDADLQTQIDSGSGAPPASLAPGPVSTGGQVFDGRFALAHGDFTLRGSWMKAWDTGTGQGFNDALDPDARFRYHRGVLDLAWHDTDPAENWELEGRLSYLYGDSETEELVHILPRGSIGFVDGVVGSPGIYEETARAGLVALYRGFHHHLLRGGTGLVWGDIFRTTSRVNFMVTPGGLAPRPALTDVSDTAAVFQPENQRVSSYLFVQDEWAVAANWEIVSGVRFDDYDDVGSTANPRVSLAWRTTPTLTTRLMYGEAFRPPALLELYGSSNPIALGNPALRPETLRNLELAFAWRPGELQTVDLNLYRFHIDDYVDFVPDPGGATWTARNVGRQRGEGGEVEWRTQWQEHLHLLANASVQRTIDRRSGANLGVAPSADAYLRLTHAFAPGWRVAPQLTWIGQRKRAPGDLRPALAGYTTFDCALSRRQGDVEISLAMHNLFDADVREPSRGPGPGQASAAIPADLPQAGRSVVLEVAVEW